MTLRSRIVLALSAAALVPTAVVVSVPILTAGRRASEETTRRIDQAGRQAGLLLEEEKQGLEVAVDRAAADLRADRDALAAVLRGPEGPAGGAARGLAERFVLDRVQVRSASGVTLASWGSPHPGAWPLAAERPVDAEAERLTVQGERDLGDRFVARVAAVTGGETHLTDDPAGACGMTRAIVAVGERTFLCVRVAPSDAGAMRRELIGAFAGTAAAALIAALLLGAILAGRIAAPIRALAERAETISETHRGPLTLLPEKDETLRLTLAFEQMLDGLSASEERRVAAERVAAWEEMARRLAHEVKNPLSPIRLAVENLRRTRERAPEAFDRAFAEETETILEEVRALSALVDEFSQFARLPRPAFQDCDPRAILAGALALYAGRIAARGVEVEVDDARAPSLVRADPEQLGRALKNVVQNALDAMEGVAGPRLAASIRRDGERTLFSVRDSGPGFGPEARRRIFEPYFTTRGDHGGTGLGMAIAQRIVAEHGGTIAADNAPGGGAVVTIVV